MWLLQASFMNKQQSFFLQIALQGTVCKFIYSMALVRKRTIPTERPPLVGEVSANV
jgi:hypothetical protein